MEYLSQKAASRVLGRANDNFDRLKNKASKLAQAQADQAKSSAEQAAENNVPSAVMEAAQEKAKAVASPPTMGGGGKVEEHLASIDKAVNNLSAHQNTQSEKAAGTAEKTDALRKMLLKKMF